MQFQTIIIKDYYHDDCHEVYDLLSPEINMFSVKGIPQPQEKKQRILLK